MGFWMQSVALGWVVLTLTNSEFHLGLLGFSSGIPQFCFALAGGLIADRVDRYRLLIANRLVITILVLVLATLIALERVQFWHILVISFLLGTVAAVNIPTFQAFVAHLVPREHLPNAVALNAVGLNVTRVVGPSLAGILIAAVGAAGAIVLQAAGSAWALLLALQMRFPEGGRSGGARHRGQLKEIFDYVRGHETISGLLAMEAVATLCAVPYTFFLPAFAKGVFGLDATGLALLSTAIGAGAALGAVHIAWTGNSHRLGPRLIMNGLAFAVALIVFGLSRWLWLSLMALFVAGLAAATYFATNNTILQLAVPDRLRGRASSLLTMIWGLVPFGSLTMGTLAQYVGVGAVVAGGGFAMFGLVLLVLRVRPGLREA